MDKGAWRPTACGVAKSRTQLNDCDFHSRVTALPLFCLLTFNKLYPQTQVHHHHNIKAEELPCTVLNSARSYGSTHHLLTLPSLLTPPNRVWLDAEQAA